MRNRGRRCRACGNLDDLEWAHRRPTALKGPGRGLRNRLLHVRKHPHSYRLLDRACHRLFDRGFLLPATWKEGWRCPLSPPGETTDYLARVKRALRPPHYLDLTSAEDGVAHRAEALTRVAWRKTVRIEAPM